MLVRGVALDDRHADRRLEPCQPVGERRSHDAAADNHHLITHPDSYPGSKSAPNTAIVRIALPVTHLDPIRTIALLSFRSYRSGAANAKPTESSGGGLQAAK